MTAKTPTYESALADLHALETERDTADARALEAALKGDAATVNKIQARKLALPTLIERARRAIAPLELAHIDDAIERYERDVRPYDTRVIEAQAAYDAANEVLAAARAERQAFVERHRDLHTRRRDARRRVQAYENAG